MEYVYTSGHITYIRLSAAHKHFPQTNLQAELEGRDREVLPEAVAGNNGKLLDREAFNGALTALCWWVPLQQRKQACQDSEPPLHQPTFRLQVKQFNSASTVMSSVECSNFIFFPQHVFFFFTVLRLVVGSFFCVFILLLDRLSLPFFFFFYQHAGSYLPDRSLFMQRIWNYCLTSRNSLRNCRPYPNPPMS